jgi:hypothetical protein
MKHSLSLLECFSCYLRSNVTLLQTIVSNGALTIRSFILGQSDAGWVPYTFVRVKLSTVTTVRSLALTNILYAYCH